MDLFGMSTCLIGGQDQILADVVDNDMDDVSEPFVKTTD